MERPGVYAKIMNTDAHRAIIVIPEIFGITGFITQTVDTYAQAFNCPAFAFDQNYIATGSERVYDYETDFEAAAAAKASLMPEEFINRLHDFMSDVRNEFPSVTSFCVVGFCFGGRLAFLAGTDKRVNVIISYYGAGPHEPSYYKGRGPVDALVNARRNDSTLHVLTIYGTQDQSITEQERTLTSDKLKAAHIYLKVCEYEAPHAFANFERSFYNEEAAEKAWVEVQKILA